MVSATTKELFERRAKEFKRGKPTSEQRKQWNAKIRNACRTDYRSWVSRWVERIERADNKGDTRTIYQAVKALGGSAAFERTKPTEHMTQKKKNPKMTNENRSSTANGETEMTKKASANENAASETSSESQTTNEKTEPEVTEAKHKTANENAGKSATKSPWPAGGQLGSGSTTNEKPEPAVTETKKSTTNDNPRKAATKAPRPADGQPGNRISSPHELARVWQAFLDQKFSQTDLERAREEFEALPDDNGNDSKLSREEFNEAVKQMKHGKATGMDNIPAEVWQSSKVAQDELFKFIKKVWSKEHVPVNLAVCIFVMIFKRKGSHNDCSKYRAIGLLNHAYKIMSVILLKRIVKECADFLSEWQAGFRDNR